MISVETISRRGFLAAGAVGAAMVGVGGFGAVSRQDVAAFVRPAGTMSVTDAAPHFRPRAPRMRRDRG